MHSYLRAIGFSKIYTEAQADELLEEVYRNYGQKETVKKKEEVFMEVNREFMPSIGITLCGVLDTRGYHRLYYFPYFKNSEISTKEDITIEERAGGDSYAGVCDDERIGVSMIFYLQNPAGILKQQMAGPAGEKIQGVSFSGLSLEGKILFHVKHNKQTEDKCKKKTAKRAQLVSAAKNGDQDAIENLTIADMDLYSMLTRRVHKEDILTIVDTYFMPYGIECDKYQIMGIIQQWEKIRNSFTGEDVYKLKLVCNDVRIDVCINAADLLGEPEIGRRFKGNIWLQGRVTI